MDRVKTNPEIQQAKYLFKHPFNNYEVIIELDLNFKHDMFEINPISPEKIKRAYDDGCDEFDFGRSKSDAAINNIVCMLIEDATNFAVEKLKEN